jgi:hypothetical protein
MKKETLTLTANERDRLRLIHEVEKRHMTGVEAARLLQKAEKVGDIPGDQAGAKRILNDAIHETLTEVNDADFVIRYTIDDGPGPLASDQVEYFYGYIKLYPVTSDNSTFFSWGGKFESKDNNAIMEMCDPIYNALVSDMAAHFS